MDYVGRLVESIGNSEPWVERALCPQVDAEIFWPEKGGRGNLTLAAIKVCSMCEVRQECLDYAIRNNEKEGIWGGMVARDRRKLRRALRWSA